MVSQRKDLLDTDYYDILVMGKTGKGKSSTVDKLLVPDLQTSESERSGDSNTGNDEPIIERKTGEIKFKNLRAKILSWELEDYENTKDRLKNIDFCKAIADQSHKEIDRLRKGKEAQYGYTQHCELLKNNEIRVLDTPGFYSPHLMEGATNADESNLAIVRHIIHVQAAENLKFKQIVYFLPKCGPLTRADRIVQHDIQYMVKFFSKTIFKCMVLVGTAQARFSAKTNVTSEEKFSEDELEETRQYFQDALEREFKERQEDTEGLPEPPIIFIAMTDTCEGILNKVKEAKVVDNDYLLEFNSKTCCKCSIEFNEDNTLCEYRKPGEKAWINPCPYTNSLCHPKILPAVTPSSLAIGVLKLVIFEWNFTKEQCVKCNKAPGSRGCLKVHTEFQYKEKKIIVEHSSKLKD